MFSSFYLFFQLNSFVLETSRVINTTTREQLGALTALNPLIRFLPFYNYSNFLII